MTFGTFIGAASKQYKAYKPSVMASKSFSAHGDCPPPPPSSNILDWHSTERVEVNQNRVTHQSADSTINAYFVARRIDVVRLFQKEYGSEAYSLHRDSVIVTIDNLKDKNLGYAVFFEYGAVVFFRLDNAQQVRCLQAGKFLAHRGFGSILVTCGCPRFMQPFVPRAVGPCRHVLPYHAWLSRRECSVQFVNRTELN